MKTKKLLNNKSYFAMSSEMPYTERLCFSGGIYKGQFKKRRVIVSTCITHCMACFNSRNGDQENPF